MYEFIERSTRNIPTTTTTTRDDTVFHTSGTLPLIIDKKGGRKTRIGEAPYFTPFAPYVHIAFDYFTPAAVNGGGTSENRGAAIRNF